ncbi:60S ribosomal export protein NMD3 [archaeon]|nr:60S ribosomal export protein NMD3 [archaeon]
MKIYSNDQYFEAIFQVRPHNKEVEDYIKKQIKKRDNVFISKEIDKKFGIDYYITSQKFARALGLKLKRVFKGTLTTSRSLHTRDKQTSKNVYRVTVCFRLAQDL